jgi:hypothetical protein
MINLPNGSTWDNLMPYDKQNQEAIEWVQDVIQTETKASKTENVREGLESRPLCNEYVRDGITVKECFVYKNDVNSKAFMALSSFNIELSDGK